eukprot:2756980-Heterocapsa_arctica.AAC.1
MKEEMKDSTVLRKRPHENELEQDADEEGESQDVVRRAEKEELMDDGLLVKAEWRVRRLEGVEGKPEVRQDDDVRFVEAGILIEMWKNSEKAEMMDELEPSR